MKLHRLCLGTLLVLGVLLLGACAGPADQTTEGGGCADCAWVRLDLTETEPRIEARRPERWAGAWKTELSYLGPEEVRDLDRIGPQKAALPAGHVRVLDQQAGSRLAFPLELGESPELRFVPLGVRDGRCDTCSYVVAVRDGETTHRLLEVAVTPVSLPAPAPVTVRLFPWAGRSVELLLAVEGPPGAAQTIRVEWGSPEVYWLAARAEGPERENENRSEGEDRPPNVLLLGIDTFRADHVGAWTGKQPSVTPSLDALAAQSDVWENAFSTFNNTNPSFASIMTGLYGKHHGIYNLVTRLDDGHVTLAELFTEAGYDTMGVVAARHLGPYASNLGQGFAELDVAPRRFAGEYVVDRAVSWLGERGEDDKPFFAWLHFFDPHTPHAAPLPYAAGLAHREPAGYTDPSAWFAFRPMGLRPYRKAFLGGHHELYAGQVAYLDRHLGRLLDVLERGGRLEDTVVALVADHGENLTEHGIYTHHNGLWDTTTHVPLLIRPPGAGPREGRRFDGLVQTLDLFPTLLGLAGIDAPPSDARDLYELTDDGGTGRRVVVSEHAGKLGLSVRTPKYRLYRSAGNHEVPDGSFLYDLAADPGETTDVSADNPEVTAELERLLDRWLADVRDRSSRGQGEESELSSEEEEQLRALGYLQ